MNLKDQERQTKHIKIKDSIRPAQNIVWPLQLFHRNADLVQNTDAPRYFVTTSSCFSERCPF